MSTSRADEEVEGSIADTSRSTQLFISWLHAIAWIGQTLDKQMMKRGRVLEGAYGPGDHRWKSRM